MARGWESKDVESQMEGARERNERKAGRELTPEQKQALRELESLELSRTRVAADLEKAQNPAYRGQLERSLQFLDEKIAEARSRSGPPPAI